MFFVFVVYSYYYVPLCQRPKSLCHICSAPQIRKMIIISLPGLLAFDLSRQSTIAINHHLVTSTNSDLPCSAVAHNPVGSGSARVRGVREPDRGQFTREWAFERDSAVPAWLGLKAPAFMCKMCNFSPTGTTQSNTWPPHPHSINSPSHEHPSTSDHSPDSPESPPMSTSTSSSLVSAASNTEEGAGSRKSKSCRIAHLIHWRASTISPLRQLRRFDIVIPPCEKARSLDTDDNIIAR